MSVKAVAYMVIELGKNGIMKYPMSRVPTKLPSVLMEVSRPTFPPTPVTDEVMTRTMNGPGIANRAKGIKNKIGDASSDPTARLLKSRHQSATGSHISTVRVR